MQIDTTHQSFKLKMDILNALQRNEFIVYYQPKLDLVSGKIHGVEALLRWEHPERGLISPLEFIPIAEETGLILPIGEWVLRTACEQNKAWQDSGLPHMIMAVNLSALQIFQHDLLDKIRAILNETGLAPEYLELEITESMMMDVSSVLHIIKDLKRIGIRISLDDFGTGYSSLYHLKEFPIDLIKIDKCFVQNCTTDTKDATIVKTIIAMAHQLKIKVIAEGIETKDQLIFLQQQLCNYGQGFFFSKPVPPHEIVKNFNKVGHIILDEGIPQKISREKCLEAELENARQELRDTMRQQQGMIIKYKERDGRFIHTLCDGELLYRIGLTPETLIGKELYDVLPIEEAERKLQYYRRAWNGEENVTYEGELNGIWYLACLRPIQRGGQVVEVIGSCVDITERKESEERYQKVVEYSPKGILIHREGTVLYANPTALNISKVKVKDAVGASIYDYIHTDYVNLSIQRLSQTEVGKELSLTEMKIICQDGEVIDVEVRSVFLNYDGSPAILTLYSDITDRKKTERALEESKEQYQRLLDMSPEPIVVQSEGIIKYINQAGVNCFGFKQPSELLGRSFLDFFHPDSRKVAMERMQRLKRENESEIESIEYKMRRQDGTIFYVEGKAVGIKYDGEAAIQGIFRDITARKQAEEALRQSEERYRLIAENRQS